MPTLLSDNDQAAAQVCRKAEKEESYVCIAIPCIVGLITLHTLHSDKIVTIIIPVEKQISIWGQVNFSKSLLTLTDFFTNQYCVIVNSLLCLIVCKRSVMLSTKQCDILSLGREASRAERRRGCLCTVHAWRTADCAGDRVTHSRDSWHGQTD